MSAYLIAQINVTDEESYKDYLAKVTDIVHKFGGEYLVRAGKFKTVLGEWNFKRNVVIKFPSYEIAIEWYNSEEYLPVRKIRENNSIGNVIIIEGG
tara:strand:+ start:10446 stop:10733 length:288 start_codon:yes stop_codon:yes gene_type:complete